MHNDHDEADTQNRTGDLLITKPFPRLGRSTEQASDAPKSAGIPIALPLRGTLCNCGDLAALLIAEHPFCGPCANGKLRAYGLSAKPAQRTEAPPHIEDSGFCRTCKGSGWEDMCPDCNGTGKAGVRHA